MTALGGMSLLMEGSTIREGKYRDNIRRAADWLMDRVQPNGLIGNPASATEGGRYMYGHGFAHPLPVCVVGEEENARRREKLVDLLEKAAKFTHEAQTNRGGWGYVSAKDGSNFDEGSVTITQVQALRAARNAGIIVPNAAIKKAQKYLEDSTDRRAASSTAWPSAAAARPGPAGPDGGGHLLRFSSGDYKSDIVKHWLKYCQNTLPIPGDGRRMGHAEYTHYYYAQVVYVLGEDRYKKIVPDSRPTRR